MISIITEITATTVNNGWLAMWSLALGLFWLGKVWVLRHSHGAALEDRVAFVLLWPGMDFAAFRRKPLLHLPLLRRGIINLILVALLIWFIARRIPNDFLATWLCMIGFIWALHGGVFTLLTAFWRSRGRDVQPLMSAPLLAASVTEFWGRRWNHGFRDLVHGAVFKPAARRFGAKAAMMIVFVVSGLVHELVVTVPARGGYGGPTLYFALQGLAVWVECGCPLRSPFLWRLRTFAFVLLPLPIAFPAPFVTNVCQPFFENLGALP